MTVTNNIDLIEYIRTTPLDEIKAEEAKTLNRLVFDQEQEEDPIPVARFGSAI